MLKTKVKKGLCPSFIYTNENTFEKVISRKLLKMNQLHMDRAKVRRTALTAKDLGVSIIARAMRQPEPTIYPRFIDTRMARNRV